MFSGDIREMQKQASGESAGTLAPAVQQNAGSQSALGQASAAGFYGIGQILLQVSEENARNAELIEATNNRVAELANASLEKSKAARQRAGAFRR
jgi:hypothetical protein